MRTREEMPACPVATTVQRIGSKWKLLILRNLLARPWRFNERKKEDLGESLRPILDACSAGARGTRPRSADGRRSGMGAVSAKGAETASFFLRAFCQGAALSRMPSRICAIIRMTASRSASTPAPASMRRSSSSTRPSCSRSAL